MKYYMGKWKLRDEGTLTNSWFTFTIDLCNLHIRTLNEVHRTISMAARMLGIRNIDRYENLIWKIGLLFAILSPILSLLILIEIIWMNSYTISLWIPNVFTSLGMILQSKLNAFNFAQLTRILNRWLFM